MLTCVIVDDEKPARDLLKEYIKEVPFLQLVSECKNAFETIDILSKQHVDVIFLDIKMPKLNGIQLLRTLSNSPYVIITTAYREYALEGFELDVTDYLKKPFSFDRFLKAALKVKMLSDKDVSSTPLSSHVEGLSTNYLFLKAERVIHRIDLNNLIMVEAKGDYSYFITSTKKYMIYTTLRKVEELLPANNFIRVHRSFIVSLSNIETIEGNIIRMNSGEVPIGKNYKDNLMRFLG